MFIGLTNTQRVVVMPYRDPEKQRAAMREIVRRHREREKAKIHELERVNKELEDQIKTAFKPDQPTMPDAEKERLKQTIMSLESEIAELRGQLEMANLRLLVQRTILAPPEIVLRQKNHE